MGEVEAEAATAAGAHPARALPGATAHLEDVETGHVAEDPELVLGVALRSPDEPGVTVPSVQGTATALPFRDESFDVVFCSFGALQFVSDIDDALSEVARVLRPGGRFAFSITHPTRWMFPDDPGEPGLTATQSYWDRTPYVEIDDATGVVAYVEHHRTLGDWVRLLAAHRFVLADLVEPEWPEDHDRVWGGWSRTRGLLTPGTAIFVAHLASR